MTTRAFCPGHITALFYAPEPGLAPMTTGSRGAGVCIDLGAHATVHVEAAEATTIVPVEDTRLSPVVAMALGQYLQDSPEPVTAHLELDLDLPVGSGFGMSGAMTFASLMALEGELGLAEGDIDQLLLLAHTAELAFSTGLGDVVAQARGGIDVRVVHGLPPEGEVRVHQEEAPILVAWDVTPLHTSSVLSDPIARQRLEKACKPHLDALEGEASLGWLLEAGWAFSREAGLVSDPVARMVSICAEHGRASQVMLGNSVFAVGDLGQMSAALEKEGFDLRKTSIDNSGVRLTD